MGPLPGRRNRGMLGKARVSLAVFATGIGLATMNILPSARAEIALVLNEPNGHGASRYTSAGHAAVYLSGVCPETPVTLRLCDSGEHGSVLSTYPNFKESERFEWNAVPVNIFLYGVEREQEQPLFASRPVKTALEQQYRNSYLLKLCDEQACNGPEKAWWRDMVGNALVRSVYFFTSDTTREQDEAFVREFNARANVNHYSGFTNNCADFARRILNFYFPHSAKRDLLNDFLMTSPKAVARSFSRYALRRPELHFHVVRYAQTPSLMPRSKAARNATENSYHQKKCLLPLLVLRSNTLPFMFLAYNLTGRFNPESEMKKYPTANAAVEEAAMRDALRSGETDRVQALRTSVQEGRDAVIGTRRQWAAYAERFVPLLREAVDGGKVQDANHLLEEFNQGTAYLDEDRRPWLRLTNGASVGLMPETILASGSDPKLAYRLMLAHLAYALKTPAEWREPMPVFERNWELMQAARQAAEGRTNLTATLPSVASPAFSSGRKSPLDLETVKP